MDKKTNVPIVILNEENMKEMIYEIRGQKVMLDFELAEIYGYETKRFNEQIKNNINRFDEDFMFQLTNKEWEEILRSKISTANYVSSKRRYLPHAFTEQGIYMLMTVLKGELAIQQSKALIKLFKMMKDYIVTSTNIFSSANPYLELKLATQEKRIEAIESTLFVVMDNFIDPSTYKHFLILDGEKIEASEAFQKIYSLAKHSIILVDDYIDIKTLRQLKCCSSNVQITICSDNVARNKITKDDLNDFMSDTGIEVLIKPTKNKVHDRYIVIDYKTDSECIYHSGSSSKDAGNKITTIMRVENVFDYHKFIDKLCNYEN